MESIGSLLLHVFHGGCMLMGMLMGTLMVRKQLAGTRMRNALATEAGQ